ncbi:MAG: VWA domain-containing protein [Gammaproteobacteria bacterium]|nr:VWA domain-containing protein [Gammaproteobacteria bacterium]
MYAGLTRLATSNPGRWTCGPLLACLVTALITVAAHAQSTAPGTYGVKVYRVDSSLYPYVQVFFRTFNEAKQPLVNLNELNVGLMVKGRSYDPTKRQYKVESVRQKQVGTRTVLVLDASKSMAGPPFESTLRAAARYIDSKRPQDEVAVLAIRDTKEGYSPVSTFERDPAALARRLADVQVDGQHTRLYDSLAAAIQLCGASGQGALTPGIDNFIVSCSVVVFSDGWDEGSALSREELNGRITNMGIPIPIYSLAYSKHSDQHFKNLEALSKNSFGNYYLVGETFDRMQQIVEEIQNIIQSDYVVTFRSYVPVDGETHALKLGIEYPSGSGKFTYDAGSFEAIEPPPLGGVAEKLGALTRTIPPLPTANPFFEAPAAAAAPPPATH